MSHFSHVKDIIIVGAGNFGAATALSLQRLDSSLNIRIIETTPHANPRAASHDINKIVRDDYPDVMYMRMMLEAMPKWRDAQDIYKPFYHEVGMLRADPGSFGQRSMEAYKQLEAPTRACWLSIPEVRQRFNGAFADGDFGSLDKVFFNPDCGWAEADKALSAVLDAAKAEGVELIVGSAKKVLFGDNGQCTGVLLEDDTHLSADAVLLATGARTAELLFDSAPEKPEIQAGNRIQATGAVSFTSTLTGLKKEKYTDVPVCKNVLPQVKGESMSMTSNGTIKFNCDMSFTNLQRDIGGGQLLSVAPEDAKYATWFSDDFSARFRQRALQTMRGLYGKEVADVEIEHFRMCWDATTPTHDFLITPHPHAAGLYLATGGSFHGWKFLPVIGDYIARMMRGELEPEYVERWAWDRADGYSNRANPTYDVEFDLSDPGWLGKL